MTNNRQFPFIGAADFMLCVERIYALRKDAQFIIIPLFKYDTRIYQYWLRKSKV